MYVAMGWPDVANSGQTQVVTHRQCQNIAITTRVTLPFISFLLQNQKLELEFHDVKPKNLNKLRYQKTPREALKNKSLVLIVYDST